MRIVACLLAVLAVALVAAPAHAGTVEYDYVEVSDGTEIAISVWYPDGFDEGEKWPALFEMEYWALEQKKAWLTRANMRNDWIWRKDYRDFLVEMTNRDDETVAVR